MSVQTKRSFVALGALLTAMAFVAFMLFSSLGANDVHAQTTYYDSVTGQTTTSLTGTTGTFVTSYSSTTPGMTTSTSNSTSVGTNSNVGATSVNTTSNGSNAVAVQVSLPAIPINPPAPMVVQVDGNGNALVRGTVITANAGMLTVETWGGIWTIRASATASIFDGGSGNMASFHAGDFVGAMGTMSLTDPWTMTASIVRDWTMSPVTVSATTNTSASVNSSGSTTY